MQNEVCQYTSQSCWFNHTTNVHENINENDLDENIFKENETNKMIQKLVEMVEKYSERIMILENMMTK